MNDTDIGNERHALAGQHFTVHGCRRAAAHAFMLNASLTHLLAWQPNVARTARVCICATEMSPALRTVRLQSLPLVHLLLASDAYLFPQQLPRCGCHSPLQSVAAWATLIFQLMLVSESVMLSRQPPRNGSIAFALTVALAT